MPNHPMHAAATLVAVSRSEVTPVSAVPRKISSEALLARLHWMSASISSRVWVYISSSGLVAERPSAWPWRMMVTFVIRCLGSSFSCA